MGWYISYILDDRIISHYGTESEVNQMRDELPGRAHHIECGETLSFSVAPLED